MPLLKLLKTFTSIAKIIFGKGINYICKQQSKKIGLKLKALLWSPDK
jgi:hypothetical protein